MANDRITFKTWLKKNTGALVLTEELKDQWSQYAPWQVCHYEDQQKLCHLLEEYDSPDAAWFSLNDKCFSNSEIDIGVLHDWCQRRRMSEEFYKIFKKYELQLRQPFNRLTELYELVSLCKISEEFYFTIHHNWRIKNLIEYMSDKTYLGNLTMKEIMYRPMIFRGVANRYVKDITSYELYKYVFEQDETAKLIKEKNDEIKAKEEEDLMRWQKNQIPAYEQEEWIRTHKVLKEILENGEQ